MSTELTSKPDPMADFYAKLQERLRADVAELLPDDALRALAQRAVEETFFKRVVVTDSYGRKGPEQLSPFEELIKQAATPLIMQFAAETIEQHRAEFEKIVVEMLEPQQISLMVSMKLAETVGKAAENWQQFKWDLQQKLAAAGRS